MDPMAVVLAGVPLLLLLYLVFFGKRGGFLIRTFYLGKFRHARLLQNLFTVVLFLSWTTALCLYLTGRLSLERWVLLLPGMVFILLGVSLLLHFFVWLRGRFWNKVS